MLLLQLVKRKPFACATSSRTRHTLAHKHYRYSAFSPFPLNLYLQGKGGKVFEHGRFHAQLDAQEYSGYRDLER